ncbi:MAG: hypothetical protein IJW97_06640 [Clostridia bacterium]|nr:hypothetical protein [Clostridia bacterium]
MAEDMNVKQALEMYNTLKLALNEMEYRYTEDVEKLRIRLTIYGEDIPMDLLIMIDADRKLIRLMSSLPFKMSEDKRVEGSLLTNHVNYLLADGSFDYDMRDGEILFRLTASYRESLISTALLRYMINVSCSTIDKVNDKFMLVNKGAMSLSDFVKSMN